MYRLSRITASDGLDGIDSRRLENKLDDLAGMALEYYGEDGLSREELIDTTIEELLETDMIEQWAEDFNISSDIFYNYLNERRDDMKDILNIALDGYNYPQD